MTSLVEVKDLHKSFQINRNNFVNAVNGIDFHINESETLGLVGESGCGKTTVGRCLVHLLKPTKGTVNILGHDIVNMSDKAFRSIRSDIQIVFQDPYDSLNPRKVVKKIIEDPLLNGSNSNSEISLERVRRALNLVELDESYLEKYPVQLTQGEQQRIGVARALVTNPKVVVLDEPTSLLDIHFRAEIVHLLNRLQEEVGIAYLFISHDLVVISQLSTRIAVMYLGRIIEEGLNAEVFNNPLHPYTKALLGASLFPDPNQKRDKFTLRGEVPSPVNLILNKCSLAPRCPIAEKKCFEELPEMKRKKDDHYVACFAIH